MATRTLPLPAAAWQPSSDESSFESAQVQVKQSSAAVPSPRWYEWLFDAATQEHLVIQFQVPQNFVDTPELHVYYKMVSATSGNVRWGCYIAAVTDGDSQDVDAKSFDNPVIASFAVPGTAGHMDVGALSLTLNDSIAAGDWVVFCLFRDADDAGDTASGDAEFLGADFRYSDS